MADIEELAQELDRVETEINALIPTIQQNRATDLVPIVTTKGKLKGELQSLTVRQYIKFIGVAPRPSIIKDGKIPWNLALDVLASERGFKDDESLKEGIEKARDDVAELDSLKRSRRKLFDDIKDKFEKGIETDTVKLEGDAPVFPMDENTPQQVTTVNGTVITARRNPSFWQLDIDFKRTSKNPDKKIRVRFAKGRNVIVSAIVKDAKIAAEKEKVSPILKRKLGISGKRPRITPKPPRLSR